MINKNIIKIISIALIVVSLINLIGIKANASTFAIESADLYSKGYCKSLLRDEYNGVTIKVAKVYYKSNGVEYPAYCLDANLDGVGTLDGYSVSIEKLLSNEEVRRVIINGYPYQSLNSLGVEDVDEAFTATKMAVYCILYDYDKDDYKKFSSIGEAGERTLTAMKKIVTAARNSSSNYESPNVYINEIDTEWTVDSIDLNYISKTYQAKSNVDISEFSLSIQNNSISGIKITDIDNNEISKFTDGTKFKILIPISELKEAGNFDIKISANVETMPILYGESASSSTQDYALTGLSYEIATSDKKVEYPKNETTVTVEKISYETGEILTDAIFNIYDENNELIYENLEVDENGLITIEGILPGTYYIEEVLAPDGYEKDNELMKFTVAYGENIIVTITNNQVKVATRVETSKKLPVTGF